MVQFHCDLSPEQLRAKLMALSGANPVADGQIQVRLWQNNRFRLTFQTAHRRGKDALFEGRFRADPQGGTHIRGRFGGPVFVAAACAVAFAPIGSMILIDQLSFKWGYFHSTLVLPGGDAVPFVPGILVLWAAGAVVLFLLLYLLLCHQKREHNARLRAFLMKMIS